MASNYSSESSDLFAECNSKFWKRYRVKEVLNASDNLIDPTEEK